MDFEGAGILALWNGADSGRRKEYNLWHSREHVPERLSVPGMRSARRYVRSSGALHEYLSLYEVETLSVLSSPSYRHLLENPTEWSRSMRPSFEGFVRKCCLRVATEGGGLGHALAVIPIYDDVILKDPALRTLIRDIVSESGPVIASHILQTDPTVPAVPFTLGGETADLDMSGALLLEAYSLDALKSALGGHKDAMEIMGTSRCSESVTYYELAYALTAKSLAHIRTLTFDDYVECSRTD